MNSQAQQFPPQKGISRVPTQARRDRGAHSKRLPCSEAAPVAFTAPIARHNSKVHETSKPTRDGNGVPKVVSRGLPKGCTIDDVISFPEEAAIWLGQSESWTKKHPFLPGVIHETERVKLFCPRAYLDARLKRKGAK